MNNGGPECDVLQQLPEFPPPEGERRPMSFRRVLLNTCQEEFEGAAAAREVCIWQTVPPHMSMVCLRSCCVHHVICLYAMQNSGLSCAVAWSSGV